MKKTVITSFLLIQFISLFGQTSRQIDEILSKHYEFKMISSGSNFPDFNVKSDTLTNMLVLLHNKISIQAIQTHFGWKTRALEQKLNTLVERNFLKKDASGNFKPNVFICSLEQGNKIKKQLKIITSQTAKAIIQQIPTIKKEISQVKAFQNINFEDVSLLILSDVLIDNWQIENVENVFLKSNRTEHHGKNYYASYQEKRETSTAEAFGIYGNQFEDTLDFSICRYGNARYSKEVIEKNKDIKIAFSQDKTTCKYPVLDTIDYQKLQNIADGFKPILIDILNKNKPHLIKMYRKSIYSTEISFEEYFIWLYHIFYTAVTDELIKQKLIILPKEKVAFYILTND